MTFFTEEMSSLREPFESQSTPFLRQLGAQDADALLPDGGRKSGRSYVNNFFFFPQHLDGESMLNG